jgi:hypothetical protein
MDNQGKKFIIGLGNPIVDISAETDDTTINKYGLSFGGTVFANSENVGFYDVLESQPDVIYIPGGSVTNSIRVTNVKFLIYLILIVDVKRFPRLRLYASRLYRE